MIDSSFYYYLSISRIFWMDDLGGDYGQTLAAAIDLVKKIKVDVLFGPPIDRGEKYFLENNREAHVYALSAENRVICLLIYVFSFYSCCRTCISFDCSKDSMV